MSAAEILEGLRADGIQIRCFDGMLRITDPHKILTEERKEVIRLEKAALMAMLQVSLDVGNTGSHPLIDGFPGGGAFDELESEPKLEEDDLQQVLFAVQMLMAFRDQKTPNRA